MHRDSQASRSRPSKEALERKDWQYNGGVPLTNIKFVWGNIRLLRNMRTVIEDFPKRALSYLLMARLALALITLFVQVGQVCACFLLHLNHLFHM